LLAMAGFPPVVIPKDWKGPAHSQELGQPLDYSVTQTEMTPSGTKPRGGETADRTTRRPKGPATTECFSPTSLHRGAKPKWERGGGETKPGLLYFEKG